MDNSLSLTPKNDYESGLDLLLAALRQHYSELIGHVRLHAARLGAIKITRVTSFMKCASN